MHVVIAGQDMVDQHIGRVRFGRLLAAVQRHQLGRDSIGIQVFALAGRGQRHIAAAAEIQLQAAKNRGSARHFDSNLPQMARLELGR